MSLVRREANLAGTRAAARHVKRTPAPAGDEFLVRGRSLSGRSTNETRRTVVLENSKAYNGFAVKDIEKARAFYGDTLGLEVSVMDEENGLLSLHLAGGRETLVYNKPDLQPGNYTLLNFPVDDIDATVDELSSRGVQMERYDGFDQDDKGIMRGPGPQIAWFKDPSGHILSVLQEG
jgi:catechol 2,3-dioxygenase-like lactoylglutathione lyase family enzyme